MKTPKMAGKLGWSHIKARMNGFDRPGLVQMIHDLYDASQENRIFLHIRLDVRPDVLIPYKAKLKRFLNPDSARLERDVSASKALAVLTSYKKALGRPEEYLELLVFYCEQSAEFSSNVGMDTRSWFSSMVRVFAEAIQLCTENKIRILGSFGSSSQTLPPTMLVRW